MITYVMLNTRYSQAPRWLAHENLLNSTKRCIMRDLNQVAEKIQGLWAGGKMHYNKAPKAPMTTDQKIQKVMTKLEKKGK
jgi:hypothetical protein